MQFSLLLATVAVAMTSVMCSPAARQVNVEVVNNAIPTSGDDLTIIPRAEWHARTPRATDRLSTPVPYYIIHHTYQPGACATTAQCTQAMRGMQDFHMDGNGWSDIGYNFCVGGDGKVYEGRGWNTVGAHAAGSNTVSIGICLIGDWTSAVPPQQQLNAAKALIQRGITLGYVRPDYALLGHRQVRPTECPGDALFHEITSWQNFSVYPRSHREPLSLARSHLWENTVAVSDKIHS